MPAGRREGGDLLLEVRVQPRAAGSGFAGLHGDRLRVRVQAPPVEGRANEALVVLLSEAFAVPRARIVIERGLTARDKRVRIRDAPPAPAAIRDLLGCD